MSRSDDDDDVFVWLYNVIKKVFGVAQRHGVTRKVGSSAKDSWTNIKCWLKNQWNT